MLSLPVLPAEDKLWLKPYVDLQAYEDPAQGALEFTQELDPTWLIVDTVIGEGEPSGPSGGSTELPASRFLPCGAQLPLLWPRDSQMSSLSARPCILPEVL